MLLALQRIILAIFILIMLSACSNSDEQKEKGRIQQTTDKIANEAVKNIKTPIEQAELAKKLTEQHNGTIINEAKSQ